MKSILKKLTWTAMTGVALTFAVPATAVLAIDRVECGDRDDFVRLDMLINPQIGTNTCFANAGVTAVSLIGPVYRFSSGDNRATINYERDGLYYSDTLEKWNSVGYDPAVNVYEVRVW